MYVSDWIKKHYPQTADAALVCKWFMRLNDDSEASHMDHFVLKGREAELLEYAKELEQEEKERHSKN